MTQTRSPEPKHFLAIILPGTKSEVQGIALWGNIPVRRGLNHGQLHQVGSSRLPEMFKSWEMFKQRQNDRPDGLLERRARLRVGRSVKEGL